MINKGLLAASAAAAMLVTAGQPTRISNTGAPSPTRPLKELLASRRNTDHFG
jgi:hypothetical protein